MKARLISLLLLMPMIGFANHETAALASPDCDIAVIKKIAGKALVSYKAQTWAQGRKGYIITLDKSIMSYTTLVTKMQKAGCYKSYTQH